MEQSRIYLFFVWQKADPKKLWHHLKLCYRLKGIREVWAKEAFKRYLIPVYLTQSCSKNRCHH